MHDNARSERKNAAITKGLHDKMSKREWMQRLKKATDEEELS